MPLPAECNHVARERVLAFTNRTLLKQVIIGVLISATGHDVSQFECTGEGHDVSQFECTGEGHDVSLFECTGELQPPSACSGSWRLCAPFELEHEGKRKSVTFSKLFVCGAHKPDWGTQKFSSVFFWGSTFITGKEFSKVCE